MQCWIFLFQRFVEAAKAQENERLVLMRDTVQQLPPPNYRYCSSRARTAISPEKTYNMMHFLDSPKKIYNKKNSSFRVFARGKRARKREKTTWSFSAYVRRRLRISFCALMSHVIALLLFLLPPLLRFYLPIFCAEFRKKKRMCIHTHKVLFCLTVSRNATKMAKKAIKIAKNGAINLPHHSH